MKILIVTETLYTGGAELFLLRLAINLRRENQEVHVLSLNRNFEDKEMAAGFQGVPITRLHLPFYSLAAFADKILRKLRIDYSFRYALQGKQLKKIIGNYDIIHSHYIQVDHLVAGIRMKNKPAHIITVHGDYSAQWQYYLEGKLRFWLRLDKKLEKITAHADQWVITAEEQRNFLITVAKVKADLIEKVYNGYEQPQNQAAVQSRPFTFGMISRGVPQKGWDLLISAFLQLPADTRLILVGGGEYLETLQHTYRSESRIVFTGHQAKVDRWLSDMDVFVLPTLFPFESLPNVIVEALGNGVPVIATHTGEIPEMITDSATGKQAGYTIPFDGARLDENELLEKMRYLYEHPEVCDEMKQTAKAAFSKFDMQVCVNKYNALYHKLVT